MSRTQDSTNWLRPKTLPVRHISLTKTTMNKELKEHAHKEFDEKFPEEFFMHDNCECWNETGEPTCYQYERMKIIAHIDSLIDKTVSDYQTNFEQKHIVSAVECERERIVGVMLNQEQNFKQLWKEYKGTKTKGEFYSYLVTNKK